MSYTVPADILCGLYPVGRGGGGAAGGGDAHHHPGHEALLREAHRPLRERGQDARRGQYKQNGHDCKFTSYVCLADLTYGFELLIRISFCWIY